MFAHAWFQHREVFWKVEGRKGLYIFFKTICDYYSLIPEDNYTIPPEAEGLASSEEEQPPVVSSQTLQSDQGTVSKQISTSVLDIKNTESQHNDSTDMPTTTISTGATTRRHKHTPSTGSFVTTILEGEEDDAPASTPSKLDRGYDQAQSHSPTKNNIPPSSANMNPSIEEAHTPAVSAQSPTSSSTGPTHTSPPTSESTETATESDIASAPQTHNFGIEDISANGDNRDTDSSIQQINNKNTEEKDDTILPIPASTSTAKEGENISTEEDVSTAVPTTSPTIDNEK